MADLPAGRVLPTGVVTFLFTDVEGSTRLWAQDEAAMSASLRVHDAILRRAIEEHRGYVFTTAGDAFCAAFQRASDATAAALAALEDLDAAAWSGPAIRVRMGVHLGEAEERTGDYFGPVVNTAARVQSAGHGGQLLMTRAVAEASGVDATSLGTHWLKDVPEPLEIWQAGAAPFPPLRTAGARSNLPTPSTRLLGRADDVRAVRLLLSEHRLVTVIAVGGSGKTRLALEVGDGELSRWRDGVWFADLAAVTDPAGVGPAVAAAIGLELRSSGLLDEVPRYLAGRQMLLVLDGCEHVIDTCAELVEMILRAGGATAVLATSREWLDVDGEHVFPLGPLPAEGRTSPAVELFARGPGPWTPGSPSTTPTSTRSSASADASTASRWPSSWLRRGSRCCPPPPSSTASTTASGCSQAGGADDEAGRSRPPWPGATTSSRTTSDGSSGP